MNAYLKIAIIALCAMLPGWSVQHAQAQPPAPKQLYIELGTVESDLNVSPPDFVLQAGEHYRLLIVNWSKELRHILMGPDFGHAVLTQAIRTYPERAAMPRAGWDIGINIPPGAMVELDFIPYKEGRYKLFCQDWVHTRHGIEVSMEVRL